MFAALVAALLVAVLIGGEAYARHVVKDCLTSQFREQLGSDVDVRLGGKPVLVEMIDHKVPKITIKSKDGRFGPAAGMSVHAVARDIRLEGDSKRAGTIGSSQADVSWGNQGIAATLKAQPFGGLISAVSSNPSDGTLTFQVGPALAQFVVKPVITNGTVDVQTKEASVLGFGLPTDLVDGIVKVIADGLQNYPIGMQAKTLKVTDDGVQLHLAGNAYDLPNAKNGGNSSCTKAAKAA
ncbi:MAG: DUF2993 domain-containing protein [Mycobacteriaceae bacterium]|nr:DUF2993 domain-containing protein [Mycobacteriaceae bacterium]